MTHRLERAHGWLFVATAAAIPIGEGLAYGLLAVAAAVTLLRWRALRLDVATGPAVRSFALGIGAWLAAGLVAPALGSEGWPSSRALAHLLPVALTPLVILSATALGPRWPRRAALGFLLALVAASLFGAVQYLYNVRPGEILVRVDAAAIAQGRLPGDFQQSVAGGFYFHRLKAAHVLIIGVAALFARQVALPLRPRRRILELIGLGLFVVALAWSFSRAAVVGLVVGIGAWAALGAAARGRRRLVAGSFGIAGVAALLLLGSGSGPGPAAPHRTLATRALIWSQALEMIADHPFGVGLGGYAMIADRYLDSIEPGIAPARAGAHNMVLGAWVETGPIGLLGFVWAWLGLVVLCGRRLVAPAPETPPGQLAWATAGLVGVTALWVTGLMHDVLFHDVVALAFYGLAGLILAQYAPTSAKG